jgi:hypothetical protein
MHSIFERFLIRAGARPSTETVEQSLRGLCVARTADSNHTLIPGMLALLAGRLGRRFLLQGALRLWQRQETFMRQASIRECPLDVAQSVEDGRANTRSPEVSW